MNRSKKGYLRTVEVVTAIIITFIFVMYIIPKYQTMTTDDDEKVYLLQKLKLNPEFSSCVIDKDTECVDMFVKEELPQKYAFRTLISDNPYEKAGTLPIKRIYVDSEYFAGNISDSSSTVVKVYYWVR